MAGLIAVVWPYILGLAALVAGWFAARQSGKAAVRNEITEAESKARKGARDVELETDAMADSAINADLAKWLRDNKR